MKIVKVEAVPVRLPFAPMGPPIIAFGRPFTGLEFVLVRIETDDGLVGWGETPWGPWKPIKVILEEFVAPAIVGRDASDVPALMHAVQKLTYVIGRYGLTMFALSGVDTALWDIAGKAAGVPLYQLLGGERRPVPAYVSLWVSFKRKGDTWDWESADREQLAQRTRGAVAAGYRHIKLHGTAEEDVRVVREAAGDDVRVMIDASCRWSLPEARAALTTLAPHQLYWIEEPIFPPEDYPTLGRLRAETGAPIAAGENACTSYEFAAMFAAGAVKFAQPNVTRVGGVTEFRKVVALAEEHGVELCPHSFFVGPGLLATLHLMAAQARPGLVEKAGLPLLASLYGSRLEVRDGHFEIPDGPGLGCDPDHDVLRECRIENVG